MKNGLVSIVMPVYNVAPFLPRTLDSLLAQTYHNFEVLCVDDGSTDESGTILDEYAQKDARIRVLHKPNGGVSAARNDALDLAQGEYIGFVDGDDTVEPDMLEFLVNALQHYDTDIAHCGYRMVHEDGGETLFYGTHEVWEQNHTKGLLDLLRGERIEPGCCNKLYKAALFADVRFAPDILYNEDLLINAELFHRAKSAVYIDECKYNYIRREGSACKSAVADKHVFHPVWVRERVCALCADEAEEVKTAAAVACLNANLSTYSLLVSARGKAYRRHAPSYRANIKALKSYISHLGRSGQIRANLIIHTPWLCKSVFGLYYAMTAKNDRYR